MPLPWPEIRDKAIAFSREWQDTESERAESQTFWNEFFAVFGVPRRRVASFEEPVKKLGAKRGRIDAFWKGQLVGRRARCVPVRVVSEVHEPVARSVESEESWTKAKKPLKSVLYNAICSSNKKRVQ